jgi:hypothetical protein
MLYILKLKGKGRIGTGNRQITAGDLVLVESTMYTGILRVKDVIITAIGWVLNGVSGLYEYTYANANITLTREVEIVPHNVSLDAVISSGISPFTTISEGAVMIYAESAPLEDITVNILIQEAKDV